MTSDKKLKQERDWQTLHDRIDATLQRFGKKDAFRDGDYWLLDEDWGRFQQEVEVQNLDLLEPVVVEELQSHLQGYPEWQITIRVDVLGKEESWPGMGLILMESSILDELQRDYLPGKFRDMNYKGAQRR